MFIKIEDSRKVIVIKWDNMSFYTYKPRSLTLEAKRKINNGSIYED